MRIWVKGVPDDTTGIEGEPLFVEECSEHGMCELHQYKDRDPLNSFFG
jgi:hypothetical protein